MGRQRAIAKRGRRSHLRRLLAEIRHDSGRAGRAVYEIGRRLMVIRDERLYEELDHPSLSALVEAELPFSYRQARKLIRVAEHFNARIAERYGVEKLDLVLRYMQATPADERPGDLLAADIRLRGDDGRFTTQPLHAASNQQIREAILELQHAKRGARRGRIPKTVRTRAEALTKALPPPPVGLTRGERVSIRRGNDGRLGMTLRALPLDDVPALLEALREHLEALDSE